VLKNAPVFTLRQVMPFGYEFGGKGYWTVIRSFFNMNLQEISGTFY
jgi:hypothetical protein